MAPTDEASLYRWIFALMAGYLLLTYIVRRIRTGRWTDQSNKFLLTHVFDGATFAGSVTLLWGIMDDDVLKAIGSTKLFLVIAGIAGAIYSIHALGGIGDGNGDPT